MYTSSDSNCTTAECTQQWKSASTAKLKRLSIGPRLQHIRTMHAPLARYRFQASQQKYHGWRWMSAGSGRSVTSSEAMWISAGGTAIGQCRSTLAIFSLDVESSAAQSFDVTQRFVTPNNGSRAAYRSSTPAATTLSAPAHAR